MRLIWDRLRNRKVREVAGLVVMPQKYGVCWLALRGSWKIRAIVTRHLAGYDVLLTGFRDGRHVDVRPHVYCPSPLAVFRLVRQHVRAEEAAERLGA